MFFVYFNLFIPGQQTYLGYTYFNWRFWKSISTVNIDIAQRWLAV
jgi:hypothetical protein